MSTQVNTYVILGVKLPYPKGGGDEEYKKYEKYMDDAFEPRQRGLVVLFDGRDGRYVIIGHVMAVTDEGGSFDDVIELAPPTDKLLKSIAKEIKAHFGLENQQIKYWVTSLYR